MKLQIIARRGLTAVFSLAFVAALAAGCARKKTHGMEGYNSLVRAQQEALTAQLQGQPAVYFRGPVQHPVILWRENLTLAEAILEAGYVNKFTPHAIRIGRQAQIYNVNVQRLLRGTDNPVLEPNDLVEVIR